MIVSRFGPGVEWFESLDSTMLEAKRDPKPGRIIVADQQTAGMGRHGRRWHSPPGEGLYVTFVLLAPRVPALALALGLAVRTVIGDRADLRWPNDVLINERKCAGVLAQVEGDVLIAGIGINVSQEEFPPDLDTPATSLLLEGIERTREELVVMLSPTIDYFTTRPIEEVIGMFRERSSYVEGKRVRASEVEGVTCGLDRSGFLRVREDNGTITTILNGGVRPI